MNRLDLDGCELIVLGVVKGLVSEADRVADAMVGLEPEAVGISLSKEEIAGLRSTEDYDDLELSELDMAYAQLLSTFGEVEVPPPCYVEAVRRCDAEGIPLVALDMNEEAFSKAYCVLIGGGELIREGLFGRRALRKRYDMSSAEAFVRNWDRRLNRPQGFQRLEALREEHMAEVIRKLCSRRGRVLAIIELQRAEGVLSRLA